MLSPNTPSGAIMEPLMFEQERNAMSDQYTRITVPLSHDEFCALRERAEIEYRHPREQARYILRAVLLGEQKPIIDLTPEVNNAATQN